MHLFRSHKDRPGMFRGHASFELPVNPVCWLLGHKPKIVIHESRYSEDYMWVECARDGRRYRGDNEMIRAGADDYRDDDLPAAERRARQRERAKDIARRRLDNARRDPENFLRSIDDTQRRNGFEGRTLALSLETHWYGFVERARKEFSAKLHLGDTGSETPIDGHLDVGVAAAYFSVGGLGGKTAEWLGRGQKRNLHLAVHDGTLRWEIWHDDEGGNAQGVHRCEKWRTPRLWPWSAGRRKYRSWMCLRDGSIELNPVSAFYGSKLWLKDPEVTYPPQLVSVTIGDFEGDTYLVDFTLEKRDVRREHGPAWARRVTRTDWSADWSCKTGIPVRNHDWKGDEILGSHIDIVRDAYSPPVDWLERAVAGVITQVRRDREHYNYRPPVAQES